MPKRLHTTTDSSAIVMATAASALPFPPLASTATVPARWDGNGLTVPQFDLKLRADAAADLTLAELYGGELVTGAIAATAIDSLTNATNTINEAAHGLSTGDGPIQLTTSGTLPAELALATDYFVIVTAAGTFKLAASLSDALAGTVVAFTDDGSGTHTYTGVSSKIVIWHSMLLLGHAAAGAVTLTARQAYVKRIDHRPGVVLYTVSATISAGNIDVEIVPVYEA